MKVIRVKNKHDEDELEKLFKTFKIVNSSKNTVLKTKLDLK